MPVTDQLERLGIIPTVYSLVYPETRLVFDELRNEPKLSEMYERAWSRQQDPMHESLLSEWQAWAQPVLRVDWSRFPHGYVAAGSSEAIRDRIAAHTAEVRAEGRRPRVHVFAGEYEGYAAYAEAYRCEVVRHPRERVRESLAEAARPGDRFFLSAPSSLDGMVWEGSDDFLSFVADSLPELRVSIDLCYVGSVGSGSYQIDLRSPAIDTVFFSLSKVFGVYYHRIGGVFCREPALGLAGNVWFKNLLSIRFGVELMRRHDVFAIPVRVRAAQERIVDAMRDLCGEDLRAADVVLLANQSAGDDPELDALYARGTARRRYCLTPALDRLLREEAR